MRTTTSLILHASHECTTFLCMLGALETDGCGIPALTDEEASNTGCDAPEFHCAHAGGAGRTQHLQQCIDRCPYPSCLLYSLISVSLQVGRRVTCAGCSGHAAAS